MVPQIETDALALAASARWPSQILTSLEAAHYIRMSDSWLRQTRMDGRSDGPPFVRQGAKAIRYRVADLDAWLERRLCTTGGTEIKIDPKPQNNRKEPPRGRRARRRRAAD